MDSMDATYCIYALMKHHDLMAIKRLEEVAMLSSKQIAFKCCWRDVVKGSCSHDVQVKKRPTSGSNEHITL